MQGGREHWAVYYISPTSFITTFCYLLDQKLLGIYQILIVWFIKLSVQTFQRLVIIYRRGNFLYNLRGTGKYTNSSAIVLSL